MAILTMMKISGEPDELLRQKHETVDPVARELASANGAIEHLVAKTDDGLLIVNLWESAEGMEKVAAEVGRVAREAGMAEPSDWHQYELVQREQRDS